MLNLDTKLKFDEATIQAPNLCNKFDLEELKKIGTLVYENYRRDEESRADWLRRTEAAMDLALQLQKEKTFPWPNCANIQFPLVTIAALQFHARAYPALINGRRVVDCRVVGSDKDGMAKARAQKIGDHMSWQVLEQDEAWEDDEDRAILNIAIVGCGFKKSYYDAGLGHNVSEFVTARDLVLNYHARSVETCRVKTHIVPMYRNDIIERCRRGTYEESVENEAWLAAEAPTPQQDTNRKDNRTGTRESGSSMDTPFVLLEQHCWLDLDKDGYEEPYIVTIEQTTQQVLRIVARCDRMEDVEFNSRGKIVHITATEYFTKKPFIPSPDRGIYDIGFGILLGPLNESVNSAINQLFDAGTLSNTAGGFLGRGAKLKGGVYSFQPFGWQRVDATGDDLRKSIFPLPVREPNGVMLNLLTLIIEYANRITGSTDLMTGENPGQNTPAETSRTMLEQGEKIYSAIFKRYWRSMKGEFKKLFWLNAIYLPDVSGFGNGNEIKREDYSVGMANVIPAADPYISSESARYARAAAVREAAATNPGYNVDEVERIFLKSMGIDDIDAIYPGQASMPEPPPDVKVVIQQLKNQNDEANRRADMMKFGLTLQQQEKLNNAKIAELLAKVGKLEAEASTEGQRASIEAFRAAIEAIRETNNAINTQLDRVMNYESGKPSGNGMESILPNLETESSDTGLAALG